MNRITETRALNSTVTLMKVEAPDVAKRAKAGQFIILRVDDKGERIPLTVADTDPATGEVVLQGASLTIAAFRSTLGPVGAWLVAIALALFAFSTILGWEYHGEKALEYLTRSTKATMVYRVLFSAIAFVGCVSAFEVAWDISDILNALMVVPNAIIMWMLVGPLVKDMDAFQQIKHSEKNAAK